MRHYRTCCLCEALCGLEVEVEDGAVRSIRGDKLDVLSHGHVCPKGVAMVDLHTDPDRLRTPMRRTATGWEPMGWEAALDLVADRLHAVREAHGRHAVGVYLGNPNVHHYGNLLGNLVFAKALRTHNRFSATSADQLPHMFAALEMFGHQLLLPVPDLDRTDHLLVLGANPYASNGSIMSAGDVRGRLQALRARGGRLVVVDPRRTETAEHADAHHFLRPGTDALLLLAMLHVIFEEGLVVPGPWQGFTTGLGALEEVAGRFPPERVADATGMGADVIRTLARELAAAPRKALYGRLGVCTQRFGGLSAWLVYAVNLVTGALDTEGGVMFSTPAADLVGLASMAGETGHRGAWHSRVSQLPEFGGELPVSALAEEIETPGQGQIRALVTVAGNPVLSSPNGRRLDEALAGLDFMVSVDLYLNETTRHAHVVLPAPSPLERDQFGLAMQALAVRDVAKYAPPLFPREGGARDDFDTFVELSERLFARRGDRKGVLLAKAAKRLGSRGLLAALVRFGPHGRGVKPFGQGLTLRDIEAHPHGLDLGPLRPGVLRGRLRTVDRTVHAAPDVLVADVARLEAELEGGGFGGAGPVLVGRRQLRSNNSWMHNAQRLVKGKDRCTLLVHPDDARAHGLSEGTSVRVRSRTGEVVVPVEVSDAMMPGVVSLPHGWGHHRQGVRLSVAAAHAGASLNDLTDEQHVDPLTGNAAFSGVPVTLQAV